MSPNINIGAVKGKLSAYATKLVKHSGFAAVILILFVYIFTVWRISQLATAEPSPTDQSSADVTSVPRVDPKAINQVQSLENSSPEVHSLFNSARNNPFNE